MIESPLRFVPIRVRRLRDIFAVRGDTRMRRSRLWRRMRREYWRERAAGRMF